MEVNEMKGVDDLAFGENPFDGSLKNNSSMVKIKRHYSFSEMMIRREDGIHEYGDHDHDDGDEMSLNNNNNNTNNNDPSNDSCGGFHGEIFSTIITGQTVPTTVFSPNTTSCYSNDTVFDPDGHRRHHQMTIMAERKLRRMISNRESARRSRMRKKKQIEELQYQVGQLEVSNRQLSEKLIQLLECNQQILHENAELKRKVSSLQIILTDFLTPLRNYEEAFCNSNNRARAEANSNSSHHLPS